MQGKDVFRVILGVFGITLAKLNKIIFFSKSIENCQSYSVFPLTRLIWCTLYYRYCSITFFKWLDKFLVYQFLLKFIILIFYKLTVRKVEISHGINNHNILWINIRCVTKFPLFFFFMKMQLYCEKMVTNKSFNVLPIVSYNFFPSFW